MESDQTFWRKVKANFRSFLLYLKGRDGTFWGAWLALFGVIITGAISIRNADQAAKIEAAQQISNEKIEIIKAEIERKNQDLSRLKFVREVLPDALSIDQQKRDSFLLLVELALEPKEYARLVEKMALSSNKFVQALGVQATETRIKEIEELVNQIKEPTKASRQEAVYRLKQKYSDNPKMVSSLLDYLSKKKTGEGANGEQHDDGRINALYVLRSAAGEVWNDDLISDAERAFVETEEAIKQLPADSTKQTKQLLGELRTKLGIVK